VFDAQDGYVLFVGVDDRNGSIVGGGSWTWKFSGGQWTNISAVSGTAPSPRVSPMMAYDSTTGSALLFGGASCTDLTCGGPAYLNDTWTFRAGAWRNVSSGTAPPSRSDGQIADDPKDSSILLFSGQDATLPRPNDTWAWGVSPPIAALSISVSPAFPVPGTPAQFNSSFQGGVGPFTHSWRFGDGGTSSTPNATHTFGADGLYVVELWVNDSAGHTATASLQVRVYAPLSVAIASAAPNPAALGQPVIFTANATGGTPPYTYAWSFGDGGVGGNLSVIAHAYTTNGPFTAPVTVHDAAGGAVGASVSVSILLQALVGSSTTNGSPPLTVHFVGQAQGGSPPYRFTWTFGDGESSRLENPTHTYNVSGTFTVSLAVLDSQNDSSVSSLVVRVGVSSASVPSGPGGLFDVVIAVGLTAAVGAAWVTSYLVQRSRRQEGERWIKELNSDSESRREEPEP
jgi:PKD repeat protein